MLEIETVVLAEKKDWRPYMLMRDLKVQKVEVGDCQASWTLWIAANDLHGIQREGAASFEDRRQIVGAVLENLPSEQESWALMALQAASFAIVEEEAEMTGKSGLKGPEELGKANLAY